MYILPYCTFYLLKIHKLNTSCFSCNVFINLHLVHSYNALKSFHKSVMVHSLSHISPSHLVCSVLQCKSLWGEAALCCIQLCCHWYRHEPLGGVIPLLLHWTNCSLYKSLLNREILPSVSQYLHNCQLIIAVYNKDLYGTMENTFVAALINFHLVFLLLLEWNIKLNDVFKFVFSWCGKLIVCIVRRHLTFGKISISVLAPSFM